MTSKFCLVCATDEGLFLDIFTHGKEFRDIIQNFLSLEIRKNKQSSYVCHKCAYELIECSKFVDKFNKVHQSETQKLRKTGYCGLCQEPGKKGFIYELRNEILQNIFKQIHDIFHQDLSSTFKTLHVCLYCRYNLDVLSDLKKVAENHSTSDDTKIDVKVIKRKTTAPPSPQLHLNPSDTDDTPVTPTMKKKSSKILSSPLNNRKCDKCELKIENKVGMYRSHHTGQTVCKDCWVIMDPHKLSTKRSKKNIMESTKRCSVFLKDVLIDPPKNTADSKKSKGPMRTEKDGHGNVVYVISDDSEMETSPKKGNSSKGTKRASSENDTKSTKRQKPSFEPIPKRETRASSVISTVSTASASSKALPKRRYSGTFEIPESEPKKLRPRGKKIVKENETVKIEEIKEKPVRPTRSSKKQSPPKIQSSSDESSIGARKNTKLLETRDKSYSPPSSRASSTSSRSKRDNLVDEEEKFDPNETRKSKRVRNLKKNDANDSKSQELSSDNGKSVKKTKKNIKKEKVTSDDSKIPDSPRASLSPIVSKKTEDNEVEKDIKNEEKTESDGDNQAYTCTICSIEFETKVEGMTHELTHSKKLEVVLKKVSVSDADEEGEKEEEKETSNEIVDEKGDEKKIGDAAEVEDAGEKEAVPDNDKKEGEDEGKIEENAKDEEKVEETPEDNQKDAEKNGDSEKNGEVEVSEEINDEEKSLDVEKAPEEENAAKCNEEPEEKTSEESPSVDDKSDDKEEKEKTSENGEDLKEKGVLEGEEKEAEVSKNEEKEAEISKDEEKEAEVREDEEITCENSEEAKLPEESSKDSEKPSELVEDDKPLTNGEKVEDSDKKEEEAVNSEETLEEGAVATDKKVHEDEEKDDVQVSEDKPEENNENNEENLEDSGKFEGRESDEDSDEEKSPEPEPLSPVPLASPDDEDDEDDEETLPEEKKIEETVTEVVDKNNCNESDELNKSAANSLDDSTEITNGEENKEAEDVDLSSESPKKTEDTDIDDASMEALEKQMKTIVGSDEDKDKDVNNKNDSNDSKKITDVSSLESVNNENRDEA